MYTRVWIVRQAEGKIPEHGVRENLKLSARIIVLKPIQTIETISRNKIVILAILAYTFFNSIQRMNIFISRQTFLILIMDYYIILVLLIIISY